MRPQTLILAGLLLLFPMLVSAGGSFTARFDLPPEASYVGSETCVDCHDDIGDFYLNSAHGVELGFTVPGTGAGSCEACHGPGSLHVDGEGDGFIIGTETLAALNEEQQAAMCLQCHADLDQAWATGPHSGSGVSCNDCHADQVHFGGEVLPSGDYRNKAEFCLQCHARQVTDFRLPFRHRVLEGQISCNDCHDPHAGFSALAWNGLDETCLNCHPEMSGPFVFEHEGVSAEDCVACHQPHGSVNDKLLTQDGNTLCLQCHFENGFNSDDGFLIGGVGHGGFLGDEARCYDCHIEIHGSNVEPTFRN